MSRKYIKIYGERNTGTHYLDQLIRQNLDVRLLPGVLPMTLLRLAKRLPYGEAIRDLFFQITYSQNLGWKHSLVKPAKELQQMKLCRNDIFFITLTKNPYSWLLSLYNRPYHYHEDKLPFEAFLIAPWRSVKRENALLEFKNPIEMWNKKNASYIAIKDRLMVINLRYEDLLSQPKDVIMGLKDTLNLPDKNREFMNITKSTKRDDVDFVYYQNYYLREKWKDELSSKAIKIINEHINDEILSYFGYKRLTLTGE